MNQENESSKPADNMERLKQEASACGPECGCHGSTSCGTGRWVLGGIILLVAAALVVKAMMKKDNPTAAVAATSTFVVPSTTDTPTVSKAVSPPPTPSVTATTPSVDLAAEPLPATPAPTTMAESPPTTAPATTAPAAEAPGTVVGKEIGAFAELNTLAADTNAVFVFIPAIGPTAGTPPTTPMQAAAKTLEPQSGKVGIFTLKAGSPDYQNIAGQMPVPGVLVLVKGKSMNAVSGEITETKLIQSFVAASSGGGCGPGSGGCGPASAGCQ